MILTVQIFQIIFYSVAIIFMGTLMFISIWGFITFNKMYKNQRIQNFLLDKIYQSISKLNFTSTYSHENTENEFDVDELINEDELFNNHSSDNPKDDTDNDDNIISF